MMSPMKKRMYFTKHNTDLQLMKIVFFNVECLVRSFHFYNCKYKEKTSSNSLSVSYNMGSCPLTELYHWSKNYTYLNYYRSYEINSHLYTETIYPPFTYKRCITQSRCIPWYLVILPSSFSVQYVRLWKIRVVAQISQTCVHWKWS